MHDDGNREPFHIYRNVALAALDLLSCIIPVYPRACGGTDDKIYAYTINFGSIPARAGEPFAPAVVGLVLDRAAPWEDRSPGVWFSSRWD